MIVKPSITFLTTDGDSELITDIQKILADLTGNASYPKAAALLLLIQAALADFITALANGSGRGTALTSLKNEKREALCGLVRSLANDVIEECQGNLTVLLTSGFPIQKPQHFPIGDLPTPSGLKLALGTHSGELDASVSPVYGSLTFNWRLAAASAPTVILQTDETSATYTTFTGLTPGVIYVVTVNVVGTAGTSDWSQSVSLMVV